MRQSMSTMWSDVVNSGDFQRRALKLYIQCILLEIALTLV